MFLRQAREATCPSSTLACSEVAGERGAPVADPLQKIFLIPSIAIARLGGSSSPQDAYRWVESPNPRNSAETTIQPDWSLVVQSGGTVEPVMPAAVDALSQMARSAFPSL